MYFLKFDKIDKNISTKMLEDDLFLYKEKWVHKL
jgi:hypothetical protein